MRCFLKLTFWFFCLLIIPTSAAISSAIGFGSSPTSLLSPLNGTGRVSFDLVPFNIPYNASALRHTSKWSYTASISTPSKFTANSKLITELSVSWPDGEGPGAKDYNWAVCVVHLPDIMNFGAGPGINGCNTAIIEDLITISAAKAILPLVCGGIASFPVPHVCKGAMA
jgi:hypothetical protein